MAAGVKTRLEADRKIRRGLALGKYAPFHRGHQLVIETALAEMDEVVVLIYDAPDVTDIPLPVRARWLRELYPALQVIEAWEGPTQVGYTDDIMRAHERYIIDTLGISGITHFYSSEPYGDHISRALGAVDRQVDPTRIKVPISASRIRPHPFRYRDYLDPLVYRDLITNVAVLGAPSTGKTTLCERLAQQFHTLWMPEYGREYWAQHQINRRLTPEQLVDIAEGHLAREEALLLQADRYLFTDTNALTTAQFARHYHGAIPPQLAALADQAATRYDLTLVCAADIPYEDTWDRSGDMQRRAFQQQIIADLKQREIPFTLLQGTVEARAAQVAEILRHFRKYRNPPQPKENVVA